MLQPEMMRIIESKEVRLVKAGPTPRRETNIITYSLPLCTKRNALLAFADSFTLSYGHFLVTCDKLPSTIKGTPRGRGDDVRGILMIRDKHVIRLTWGYEINLQHPRDWRVVTEEVQKVSNVVF